MLNFEQIDRAERQRVIVRHFESASETFLSNVPHLREHKVLQRTLSMMNKRGWYERVKASGFIPVDVSRQLGPVERSGDFTALHSVLMQSKICASAVGGHMANRLLNNMEHSSVEYAYTYGNNIKVGCKAYMGDVPVTVKSIYMIRDVFAESIAAGEACTVYTVAHKGTEYHINAIQLSVKPRRSCAPKKDANQLKFEELEKSCPFF